MIIDGDIESNPGPMSSVEAYRAAIGRFYGRPKNRGNIQRIKPAEMTLFLFIMTFLPLPLYVLLIAFISIDLFVYYGYALAIVCFTLDFLFIGFQDMAHKEVTFRLKSHCNGVKVNTLVHYRYLDTCVIDGRDGKSALKSMMNYSTPATSGRDIDSRKIYKRMIHTINSIMLIGMIWFSIYVTSNILR